MEQFKFLTKEQKAAVVEALCNGELLVATYYPYWCEEEKTTKSSLFWTNASHIHTYGIYKIKGE